MGMRFGGLEVEFACQQEDHRSGGAQLGVAARFSFGGLENLSTHCSSSDGWTGSRIPAHFSTEPTQIRQPEDSQIVGHQIPA